MNVRIFIIVILAALLIAGCSIAPPKKDKNGTPTPKSLITSFKIDDYNIYPGQKTIITMTAKNPNDYALKNFQAELYNTGPLRVNPINTCKSDLRGADENVEGESLECKWEVWYPEEEVTDELKEKYLNIGLFYSYESSLNTDLLPFTYALNPKVHKESRKFENSDLTISVEYDSSVELSRENIPLKIELNKKREGIIKDITLDYKGASFDCPKNIEGALGRYTYSCHLSPFETPSDTTTYTFGIEINYKYEATQTLDIVMVNG